MKTFPALVKKLCYTCDAWIIGSAIDSDNPRDYDVVVPFTHWKQAAALIPVGSTANSFGGFKCICSEKEIDVWPAELGDLFTYHLITKMWHPRSGTLLIKSTRNL